MKKNSAEAASAFLTFGCGIGIAALSAVMVSNNLPFLAIPLMILIFMQSAGVASLVGGLSHDRVT